MTKKATGSGFTLIELMVTVAIVGVLAAIAYPSYMASVRKSNRSDAQTEMMDLAQRLQRCYTAYSKYNDAANCAVYVDINTGGYETRGGWYNITFDAVNATSYTLKATAIRSPQTSDTDCDDEMRYAHTGAKSPEVCW